jgi:hypothetical protein
MPTKHEAAKRRDRKADVASDLARLKGKSRSDLADDKARGAASPLGGKKMKEKGR